MGENTVLNPISIQWRKYGPLPKNPNRQSKGCSHWLGYFILIVFVATVSVGCSQGKSLRVDGTEVISSADNDFVIEARMLYKMATDTGEGPVLSNINSKVLTHHSAEFKPRIQEYRDQYVASMKPFIAKHRPDNLPTTVVYPFGGGDLLTALMTYPDASEIYTLSLELAGDIRNIDQLDSWQANAGLSLLRRTTEDLLILRDRPTDTVNTNDNLKSTQRGPLPGQITLFLVALAIYGQEPVSLRYFAIDDSGYIRYLSTDEIAERKQNQAKPLSSEWNAPDFSDAFSNCEIRFKPYGKAGPIRVHRHIAANLDNSHFGRDSPLFKHLMGKGRVVAMTKGALYLLWTNEFTNLRDYLIEQVDFMISDSTGLSPLHALPAGFGYMTFGKFKGIFSDPDMENNHNRAMFEVFQRQPYRWMPYRYGYADKESNPHMVFMRRDKD